MNQTRRYLGPNKKFTTKFGKITTECAKLRASRAYVLYVLTCLTCLRAFIFLRALRVFIFLQAFSFCTPYVSSFVYLPSFFYEPSFCYVPCVFSFFMWLHYLRAYILFVCFQFSYDFAKLRAFSIFVLRVLRAFVSYVPSRLTCLNRYAP